MAETGPVDFDSMDDDELEAFLQKRYDDALARLNANTPECLAAFDATPTRDLDEHAFDGHGEKLNKIYSLRCKCGGERFEAIGYHTDNRGHNIFVSPLALRCAGCSAETDLIDTAKHGYDAAIGSSVTVRARGERGPFACVCGGVAFKPYVRFEYPPDMLEDSVGDFTGNEHNLFSWFTLIGDCATCGKRIDITEFETA